MPELPEVEIIRRGIVKDLPKSDVLSIQVLRKDLRFPMPVKNLIKLKNKKIIDVERRGKFLIFKTTSSDFVSHLGMTGHWRFEKKYVQKKHDHVIISWESQNLIYNDPRRFGYILNLTNDVFKNFGPDPIEDKINVDLFSNSFKKTNTNIKSFLLNQKNILGIGNIYVSEILFKSKIHPLVTVKTLNQNQWKVILEQTHKILTLGIQMGGSSLRDYKNVDGQKGDMQNHWLVYGKENKPCAVCKVKIKKQMIANRSSYFCSNCQIL